MINKITSDIIGAAIQVHRYLGPGLLESSYKTCLSAELRHLGLRVEREKAVRIRYRDVNLTCAFRIDLLVERTVVVELKVADKLAPVHVSQVLTYLRFGGYQVGLLFNFNVDALAAGGIRRVVYGHNIPKPSDPSVSPELSASSRFRTEVKEPRR